MDYNFYFETEDDAYSFYNDALDIARNYGYVSLSDLHDLASEPSSYAENLIGWSEYSVATMSDVLFNPELKKYTVLFSEPDYHKIDSNKFCEPPQSYIIKNKPASSEPINITIYMNKLQDSLEVFHEVFDTVNKTKGRPIFITIS